MGSQHHRWRRWRTVRAAVSTGKSGAREGVGGRNEEERSASLYNLQCKRLDSARADWLVMVTYRDFRGGCCTNLPFVLRLAQKLTSRKFPGPEPERAIVAIVAFSCRSK